MINALFPKRRAPLKFRDLWKADGMWTASGAVGREGIRTKPKTSGLLGLASSGGQASMNATVRSLGNPALPVQLSDWKERVTITEGAVSNRTGEKTPSCQAL